MTSKITSPVPNVNTRRIMRRAKEGKITPKQALEFFLRELELDPKDKGANVAQHFLFFVYHNHRQVFDDYMKTYTSDIPGPQTS